MKKTGKTLSDVREVYSGPEGVLWEMLMGEQIHVGGWDASQTLAQKAGITAGQKVLDLCSALGAGLRFLVQNYGIEGYGLDATQNMIDTAERRTREDGLSDKIEYRVGDVMDIPWSDGTFDVVWGEDAWCYVMDKDKLISEAARVLQPGGTIAFTDWIEGPSGMSEDAAQRICNFMKFPYVENQEGYEKLLRKHGFSIEVSEDLTEDFAGWIDYYMKTVGMQKTFDALRIIGWDMELFKAMGGEMQFMAQTAHQGGFGRGRFIAKKE